jgi:hypothetical protein
MRRPLFVGRELSTSEEIWLICKLLEHDGRRVGYPTRSQTS